MANKNKAMVLYPNDKLVPVEWSGDSYEFLKNTIGGYIERVPLDSFESHNIDVWCDEEGKLKNLEPSIALYCDDKMYDYLSGVVVFTKFNDDGDTLGLTDDDINFIFNKLTNGLYSLKFGVYNMLPVLFYDK